MAHQRKLLLDWITVHLVIRSVQHTIILNIAFRWAMSNVLQITNKIQEIELILTPNIDVLCVNERWLNENNFMIYNLPGYKLASIYYCSERSHGGASTYMKNSITFTELDIRHTYRLLKCILKPVLSR